MPSSSSADVAEVLRKRHKWLPHLQDVSLTKPELCSELGISRSTVDRGVADLETVELIERTSEGYRLTAFGSLLLEFRTSYMNTLDTIYQAQAMQTSLPTGEHGEYVIFDGADVVLPEPHLPEKPTRQILELLTEARSVRGFTPVMHDQYVTTSYEQVVRGDLDFEFIITSQILEGLVSMYSEWIIEALKIDLFTVYEAATLPTFGIALFEREDRSHTVVLAIYADNGLSGIVQNDTDQAVGWAKQIYNEYKHAASLIDADTIRQLEEQTDTL
ncbi:helix-turn-helix transcriptional regulator [Halocatena marina]|uniref:helix-turn-helix transcriptional regulator n=1 Tax=Halocatena marina TaxID=2934937 RepID=UPI003F5FAC3B